MSAGQRLRLDAGPPLAVPLRFLLTVPLFGLLAAAVLAWSGPAALASRWMPVTLGLTHLLTLGMLLMAMAGALFQVLPVLSGRQPWRAATLAPPAHALLCTGTLALAEGLGLSQPWLIRLALPLLLAALALLAATVLPVLLARRAGGGLAPLRGAALALTVTVLLGLWLGLGHADLELPLARHWTDRHALWGLLGMAGLTVFAVGSQVVPMFLVTPAYPRALQRLGPPALLLGLLLLSLPAGPAGVGALLVVGLVLTFAVTTLILLRRRRRRTPDPLLAYWVLAMLALLAALLLWLARWPWPVLSGASRLPLSLGVLLLIGAVLTLVCGMLHKITAFLCWLHLSRQVRPQSMPPNLKELLPDKRVWWHWRLHALSSALLLAAVWQPERLARPAALAFALACAVLLANLLHVLQRYRRWLDQAMAHSARREPTSPLPVP
ncbi:MAG TPA: permease [Candidatus Competibacteraceae bacterium]|nr:permease [Candidatus Competibacteraceae bacterium]